jgi:tRNA threonylcarbamoyladenosine biosynthesis protein TsaB
MRILALEATTEACSVALVDGDRVIGKFEEPGKGYSERLLGMVDEVLGEAGFGLPALDGIAAGIGPGAFSGVRITVAVAQGLAFGAGLPVVPVSSLEALALQILDGRALRGLACLDARMGEVYWACYAADAARGLTVTLTPRVGAPATVRVPGPGRCRGIGRGFAAYPALAALADLDLDPADAAQLPNARETARLGVLRLAAGEGLDPADLTPLYVRDKVALTTAERAIK